MGCHTQFIVVDHETVLLTRANVSYDAENRNVEFGLLIRDSGLVESIESTMASKRGILRNSGRRTGHDRRRVSCTLGRTAVARLVLLAQEKWRVPC